MRVGRDDKLHTPSSPARHYPHTTTSICKSPRETARLSLLTTHRLPLCACLRPCRMGCSPPCWHREELNTYIIQLNQNVATRRSREPVTRKERENETLHVDVKKVARRRGRAILQSASLHMKSSTIGYRNNYGI